MTKFLIVGFDGLRRDAAASGKMPRLSSFIREWSWCAGHRAVFPVETYVNHPSIFTGFSPRRHGIIANMFPNRPGASEAPYFLGSQVESVEANDRLKPLFGVPSMGEILGARGLAMRVIGSNSPGSTRLKHHKAGSFPGHLNLPVRDLSAAVPAPEAAPFRALHGEGYPLEFPDLLGSAAVVDSFFEMEAPRSLADVTVLWLGEPDHSSHQDGPDGPRTAAALEQADALFGHILDWWRGREDEIQLLAVSDHGHVVAGRHSNLRRALEDGGIKVVSAFDLKSLPGAEDAAGEADLVISGNYCMGLWQLGKNDPKILLKAARILQESPDLGMLLTSRGDLDTSKDSGIFPESLTLSDHPRSPDLRLVAFGDPETGLASCEPGAPLGTGIHGGLLPGELDSLCAWGGNLFKRGNLSRLPSSPPDICATILHVLGFGEERLGGLDGRVLTECLASGAPEDGASPAEEAYTSQWGGFSQILRRSVWKGRVYLGPGHRLL